MILSQLLRSLPLLVLIGAPLRAADPLPVVSIRAAQSKTSEPIPTALILPGLFVVTRAEDDLELPLRVRLEYTGTADAADYEELPGSVEIPAGTNSFSFFVLPRADDLLEGAETVVAKIVPFLAIRDISSASRPYTISERAGAAEVRIADEDSLTEATMHITQPANGTAFPARRALTIKAVAADPVGYISRVEFYANETLLGISELVFIQPPEPGTPIEHSFVWTNPPPGRFVLTARGFDRYRVPVISERVNVTFEGDNQVPVVSVLAAVESTELWPHADFADGIFEFRRTGPTDNGLLIFFDIGGTATAGVDYTALPNNILIPSGRSSARLDVHALDDDLAEGDETVLIELKRAPEVSLTGFPTQYTINAEHRSARLVIRDNDRPVPAAAIVITKPLRGEVFPLGAPIQIEAVAADPDGYVPRLEFYAGEQQIGVSEIVFVRAPDPGTVIHHSLTWEEPPAGEHALTAHGISSTGQRVVSQPVRITVGEKLQNDPPRVAILSPRDGTVFHSGHPIEIEVTASDRDGKIEKLELFVGDTLLGEAAGESKLLIEWTHPSPGQHTLVARARDDAGNERRSSGVRVLVREPMEKSFVLRELPDIYSPGEKFTVHLRVAPLDRTAAYSLEDQPPRGWSVSGISHEGVFDAASGKVRFGRFMNAEDRLLSYEVTPSESATGRHEFTGSATADGRLSTIGGDRIIASSALVAGDDATLPRMPAVERDSEGGVRLKLEGAAGQVCILEASTDLRNWVELKEVFLPDGQLDFAEEAAGGQRYYRLRIR